MTLKDYHQIVLFKIMDTHIDDIMKWVCVDRDGRIFVYEKEPQQGMFQWRLNVDGGTGIRAYHFDNAIPNHLSWWCCKWKL